MDTKKRLNEIMRNIPAPNGGIYDISYFTDYLIANGVMIAPVIPGPSEDNHNMAELCFRNGEEHFREKVINKLMDMQTNVRGVQYSQLVALVEIVRCL